MGPLCITSPVEPSTVDTFLLVAKEVLQWETCMRKAYLWARLLRFHRSLTLNVRARGLAHAPSVAHAAAQQRVFEHEGVDDHGPDAHGRSAKPVGLGQRWPLGETMGSRM